MKINKDLVVIGSGPGGYEVAIKAASKGLNVALIEKDKIGGTCLNYGCIPTKALYKNASVFQTLKKADTFGFSNLSYDFSFSQVQKRKKDVIEKLRNNIELMLKKADVSVYFGKASFIDEYTIEVTNNEEAIEIQADYFIIATGSSEKIIPIEGVDLENVVTSKEMLDLERVPEKIIVIGGGVIGVEMATIFNEFGAKVEIYEYFNQILPMMDKDISSRLRIYLKKLGIDIYVDALVEKIEKTDESLVVTGKMKNDKTFSSTTEYVLLATGREAYYDNLNLEKINVLYDKNGIVVNENMQTSVEHIYACGDVTGFNMLAHVATYQSYKALDHILNNENNTNFHVIPACVFTFPEVASVGLTEDEAKEKFGDVKISKYMYRANGKALAMGEEDGFVKLISANGKIVGGHIIGIDASSLIQEITILIERQIDVNDAKTIIYPHPTLSEIILEAIKGL